MADVSIGALMWPALGFAMLVAWVGILGVALLWGDTSPQGRERPERRDAAVRAKASHPSNQASTTVEDVSLAYLTWLASLQAAETWGRLRTELVSEELVFDGGGR